jgi:molybdate-binding protein
VLPSGNPLDIKSIEDAAARRARITMRPQGAGAQLLLLALLAQARLKIDDLVPVTPPCPTGPDVAQAIRAGRADCGIATRSVATGLDFVPLAWESFDLVLRQHEYFRAPLQSLLGCLATPAFHARAGEMGGYDTSIAGTVRYAA